jgi:hypothetical protein
MRIAKYIMTAAAATLAATPVLAAPANPAASLSVAQSARVGTPSTKADKASGGGIIVAVLAAAAVIAGIIVIADSDDNADSN